jgi:hypothetical protein
MERPSNTQAMLSAGSKAKLVSGTVLLAAVAFIASGAGEKRSLNLPVSRK